MADPTPPSDIPDPASPTPASPVPTSGPGPVGGPKRIRSMPDRPGSVRPAGSIRSVPEQARGGAKMSGTYVDTLSKEKSWGRALAILWGLFLVVMSVDIYNATCYCLAGKVGWPLPVEVVRIGLFCTAFIALWSGLGLTRYLLVLVSFLAGIWLWTDCTLSYRAYPQLMATGSANWAVYSTGESIPKIAVGLFCLVIAGYALFSYDLREFIVHRRVRGRIWSALLSAVVVYGLMLAVFAVPLYYGKWMQDQHAEAQRFGDETLRNAAETWEPNVLDTKLDPGYAKNTFTKPDRVTTFGNFKALGRVKSIEPAPVVPRPPLPQFPLQDKYPIPQGIESQADATRKGFELTAKYGPVNVEFEHGRGRFGFDLARPLSESWRIMKLNVETVQYDARPKPSPSPDATPATPDPAGSPTASPALSPSPVSSPASPVPPAAAPTASVPPVTTPAASVAVTPAAAAPAAPTTSPAHP